MLKHEDDADIDIDIDGYGDSEMSLGSSSPSSSDSDSDIDPDLELDAEPIHQSQRKEIGVKAAMEEPIDICGICRCSFVYVGAKTLISCGHRFHPHCISNWESIKFSCPLCRSQYTESALGCTDFCFEHARLLPVDHGQHQCLPQCTHFRARPCSGQCLHRQQYETSPIRNPKIRKVHIRIQALYFKQKLDTNWLQKHTQYGLCVYCKQSVYCSWSGKEAISKCPRCNRAGPLS